MTIDVASFLADYGLRVAVSGLRGCDNREIFCRLAAKGIADCFVDIPGATRTGIKSLDPEAAGHGQARHARHQRQGAAPGNG